MIATIHHMPLASGFKMKDPRVKIGSGCKVSPLENNTCSGGIPWGCKSEAKIARSWEVRPLSEQIWRGLVVSDELASGCLQLERAWLSGAFGIL
jgi:hypothetical protein